MEEKVFNGANIIVLMAVVDFTALCFQLVREAEIKAGVLLYNIVYIVN